MYTKDGIIIFSDNTTHLPDERLKKCVRFNKLSVSLLFQNSNDLKNQKKIDRSVFRTTVKISLVDLTNKKISF